MPQSYPIEIPLPARTAPRQTEPTRIIEIGEVVAGIAVPEGGRVRFFSSARVFDSLDGTVFGSIEHAARAARARVRAVPSHRQAVR